jgi:predicted RNA-binding Zn-ribbon protein involved in translation (DUF1610 family)
MIHTFICDDCHIETKDTDTMIVHKCPQCGKGMRWDMAIRIRGETYYARPIISQSLAMHPSQIEEHRKLFPDIKVTPDGCPIFDNYKDHDNYLKATGFVKNPKKS